MGRRGPKPEPTALKLLKGNPGKRAINQNEPQPALAPKKGKGARRCPAWLAPAGKRLWKALVPELERLNLLTKVDDATLEGACAMYARALQAESIVKKQGILIVTKQGFVLQNPAVSIAKNSWALWRQFAAEFGITPSARSRINIKPAAPTNADPDEDFLFGKKTSTGTDGQRGS